MMKLQAFIRSEGAAIMARWEERARSASVASQQSRGTLIDQLPKLLEEIAADADTPRDDVHTARRELLSRKHAVERIEQGYCLAEVVDEYASLRACIYERLEEMNVAIEPAAARRLNAVLDQTLRETSQSFLLSRERMLRALDVISALPRESQSLQAVLTHVLNALKQTAGADIDSAALFIAEGESRLILRAAVGLDEDLRVGVAVPIGEDFAGAVAENRQPISLTNAATDPMVKSQALRRHATRALYGVPLLDEGRLVGVAHIGSRRAFELAQDDLFLFRAVAERATRIIIRAQLIDELEKAALFREQLMAVVAHDLRNPLNAIIGTMALLSSSSFLSKEELELSHRRVSRSAKRMNALIDDLLDFTRVRLGGGFQLHRSRFALARLVREVVDELLPSVGQREIVLESPSDVVGFWDRKRLAQAISNLVGNAISHSPDGSKIVIFVHDDGQVATLAVRNAGAPIPMAVRDRLFEPFERSRASGGLGLGLFIAKEIANAHRGSIDLTSTDSETTFTLHVPLSETMA